MKGQALLNIFPSLMLSCIAIHRVAWFYALRKRCLNDFVPRVGWNQHEPFDRKRLCHSKCISTNWLCTKHSRMCFGEWTCHDNHSEMIMVNLPMKNALMNSTIVWTLLYMECEHDNIMQRKVQKLAMSVHSDISSLVQYSIRGGFFNLLVLRPVTSLFHRVGGSVK